MPKLLFIAAAVLVVGLLVVVGWQKRGRKVSSTTQVNAMKANQDRLYADVEFLTELRPARSYRHPVSLNKAADYIKAEFEKLDCRVEEQPFKVDGQPYRNIIASFGPATAERIIVGAHYDVCGDQPGADDNASAVAGLLETARLLHAQKPNLTRRIDFVAYSLEEPPFFGTEDMGSAVHAKSLHDQNVAVRAMICYEMIGYFSDEPGSQRFPNEQLAKLFPNTGNFITVVGKEGQEAIVAQVQRLMQAHAALDVQRINLPSAVGLAGLSDHRNYWRYGYEALMINDTSFLRNANYHQPTDTIDTLDFRRMAEVVNGVLGAILGL
ncbi:M28 family peptidase [Hymenobacter chitinivorans]|uniref:Peptidase M28-like protein n=1 Tax=Hymenobacter chitinivorans DSM 11115 TaxID=1121954 RepID=A0A2M9BLP4_9BACT|nr:M28 family peptidase [Hymenobacter chitinivorans]PJJ58878.1 peptidase M28-like protein [Hymenobacter chitinivorans DSM 11115]